MAEHGDYEILLKIVKEAEVLRAEYAELLIKNDLAEAFIYENELIQQFDEWKAKHNDRF